MSSRARRPSERNTLRSLLPSATALLGGASLLVACSGTESLPEATIAATTLSPGEAAAAAAMVPFSPEDLAVNFASETEARRSRLTLADLGLSNADIEAIMMGTIISGGRRALDAAADCIADASNWRVTGLRLAPNALAVPGQPEAWGRWAASQGGRIDRLAQMRYVVRPFCVDPFGDGTVAERDFALHVAFEPLPASTTAAQRDTLLARGFVGAVLAGDTAGADRLAKEHLAAISAPSWSDHRAGVILDWNGLAALRTKAGRTTDPLSRLLGTLTRWAAAAPVFSADGATSPDLLDAKGGAAPKEVERLTRKFAVRRNLSSVTSMFTNGGLIWQFGAFSADAEGRLAARRMLSFDARVVAGRVEVKAVTEQQARTSIVSAERLPGISDAVWAEHEYTEASSGDLRAFGAETRAKLLDTGKANPSTMSCEGCHSIMTNVVDGALEDQYNFHMMGPGRMNALTAVEALEESAAINAEFGLKGALVPPPPAPTPTPAVPVADTCVVTEEGFANVRASTDTSTLKASFVKGTRAIRRPELDVAGRRGVQVSGWVHFSNTTCSSGSPAACAAGATVNARSPVALGPSSASGVNVRPVPGEGSKPLGIVANGQALTVVETRPDGWIKVVLGGTLAGGMCR